MRVRPALAALLLLAAPAPALAAEPKAVVSGPSAVVIPRDKPDVTFYLDVSGSVADAETPVVVGFGEQANKPTVRLLQDDGKPSVAKVTASQPGAYDAVVAAKGRTSPEEPEVTKFAVHRIIVTKEIDPPTPTPTPPTPTPTPTPPVPPPGPQTIGEQLGRSFGPKLAATLADAFDTAATMIAAGTSVKEADEALKAKFAELRAAAFYAQVAPTFAAVVPPETDPKDAATRAAFAQLHRDFARGLRGAQ